MPSLRRNMLIVAAAFAVVTMLLNAAGAYEPKPAQTPQEPAAPAVAPAGPPRADQAGAVAPARPQANKGKAPGVRPKPKPVRKADRSKVEKQPAAHAADETLVQTLRHAFAPRVADHLQRLFRGALPVRVAADKSSNVLMVRGDPAIIAEVRRIVRHLEQASAEQAQRSEWNVRVFALQHPEARIVRDMILKLAPFSPDTPPPRIECDRRTNSLVVNAVVDDFAAIERIIEAVDVVGN